MEEDESQLAKINQWVEPQESSVIIRYVRGCGYFYNELTCGIRECKKKQVVCTDDPFPEKIDLYHTAGT